MSLSQTLHNMVNVIWMSYVFQTVVCHVGSGVCVRSVEVRDGCVLVWLTHTDDP